MLGILLLIGFNLVGIGIILFKLSYVLESRNKEFQTLFRPSLLTRGSSFVLILMGIICFILSNS